MPLLAAVRTCGRSRARPAPRAVALAGLEDRVALLANRTVDFVLATISATPERAEQVRRPLHVQQCRWAAALPAVGSWRVTCTALADQFK